MFQLCHQVRQSCVTSLLMLGILAYSSVAQANPSNKNFDDGFSIHGKEFSAALVKQAHGLYTKANAEVMAFAKIAKSNRGARRLNWKLLGQNEVRLHQLLRVADQLELLGETAGVDYCLAKAKQLQQQHRLAETPDFNGILRDAEAAAMALAAYGVVSVDGENLTGPEALTKFGERWAEAQVKTIRCRTLEWLLAETNQMDAMYGNIDVDTFTNEGLNRSKIVLEFDRFNKAMMQSLAQLIEADAKRVSGADAVHLYVEYLQACAPLIRRSANRSLAPVIKPALQAMARRAPQFPLEVAAYAEGTDDLLRWRGRVARNRARVRAAGFPSLDDLMFEATRSDGTYAGLYPIARLNPNHKIASLLASAPEVMPRPIARLQGQRAHALDVVRLGKNRPVAIARYRVRSYANIPAPLDLAAETDALKFDLMVDEKLPAISILAAVAVDSAERGDLAAVGGTITNQYLESLMTRFGALPTAASVISALGTIPQEQYDYGHRDQVLMRFDLTPSWAQHDFFFVEFSPPATPTE